MAVYKQPREEAQVRIHTAEYRIYGLVHLVPGRSTADLFNLEQRKMVPITSANLFAPGLAHPPAKGDLKGRVHFMGLNRSRVLWVVGGRPTEPSSSTSKPMQLALLHHEYMLSGQIWIPKGQRLSDHLYTSNAFQTLFAVKVYPLDEGQSLAEVKPKAEYDFVTTNVSLALAVIEG